METKTEIIPANNNKIIRYILSLHGKKSIYAILYSVGIALIPLIFAYFDGNFINPELTADVVRDYGGMLFYLVGFPTMLVTTILYANKFTQVLDKLKENHIIQTNEEQWSSFKSKANKLYSKWYYNYGPYIIAFVVTVFLFFTFRKPNNPIWYSLETDEFFYMGAWVQLLVYYATFFTFSLSLFVIFGSYRILRILFKTNKINVQPLHPDKCGGLAPLGALSRTLNLAIVFIGVIVAINLFYNTVIFQRELYNFLQISIMFGYLICAYIIFFLPMHAAHKPMKEAKQHEMELIHQYMASLNKKFKSDFEDRKGVDSETFKKFHTAKKIYDISASMPVYPYNIKTITSFISSILIPVIIFLLQEFISGFIK